MLGCSGGDGDESASLGASSDETIEENDGRVDLNNPWLTVGEQAQARSAPSLLAGLGGLLFQTPIPTGNGRACATCHVPEKNFTISPEQIEQRFQENPNDPLFRSIDADDFESDFTTVRTKGLFRVTLPLPPNVKLADDPSATTVQVWRAVPTVFNVKLTAPYTHDGRAAALDEQAEGAAIEHSRPQIMPSDLAFDLVALFQQSQFSSKAVKNISDLIARGETPPPQGEDYDKPLNALEQEGFELFQFHCGVCHSGNLRNVPDPSVLPSPFVTVLISEFNRAQLPVRDFDVTNPDGSVTRITSPDPGRLLITGNAAEAGFFDITQLRGIGKTAPYFHDNSSPDLTDVVRHYNNIFPLGGFPTVPEDKIAALVAYLNRL